MKPKHNVLSLLLAIITPNELKQYFPKKAWGRTLGELSVWCPTWYFTGHLCMSNCVFCVKRAGCARQKLIRTPAKGLFLISGLSEESAGQGFQLQMGLLVSSESGVQVSTHCPPPSLFSLNLCIFYPADSSQGKYMASCGHGEQIFSGPSSSFLWGD